MLPSQRVLALTLAGWLASPCGGCSAVVASVRDESHRWDAKSQSPPAFMERPRRGRRGLGAVTPG